MKSKSPPQRPLQSFFPPRLLFASICLIMVSGWGFLGCENNKDLSSSSSVVFVEAKVLYEKEKYIDAILGFEDFITRFPYSQNVLDARLLMADAYFESKQYAAAASAYRRFLILYPEHPQNDYVLFKIGLSYWHHSPQSSDREQTYTKKSLGVWQKLQEDYPASPHLITAEPHRKQALEKIALSQLKTAQFYCRTRQWINCVYRLDQFIQKTS